MSANVLNFFSSSSSSGCFVSVGLRSKLIRLHSKSISNAQPTIKKWSEKKSSHTNKQNIKSEKKQKNYKTWFETMFLDTMCAVCVCLSNWIFEKKMMKKRKSRSTLHSAYVQMSFLFIVFFSSRFSFLLFFIFANYSWWRNFPFPNVCNNSSDNIWLSNFIEFPTIHISIFTKA